MMASPRSNRVVVDTSDPPFPDVQIVGEGPNADYTAMDISHMRACGESLSPNAKGVVHYSTSYSTTTMEKVEASASAAHTDHAGSTESLPTARPSGPTQRDETGQDLTLVHDMQVADAVFEQGRSSEDGYIKITYEALQCGNAHPRTGDVVCFKGRLCFTVKDDSTNKCIWCSPIRSGDGSICPVCPSGEEIDQKT